MGFAWKKSSYQHYLVCSVQITKPTLDLEDVNIVADTQVNFTCFTNNAHPSPSFTWWKSHMPDGLPKEQITDPSVDWDDPSTSEWRSTLLMCPRKEDYAWFVWCEADQGVWGHEQSAPVQMDVRCEFELNRVFGLFERFFDIKSTFLIQYTYIE